MNAAIDYCPEHGILYEILKKHRSEVLGMLLEEFDVDKYERTIRQRCSGSLASNASNASDDS